LRYWTMSFANFIRENSGGIHQVEGQLEMAKDWNCFRKFFIFENFSNRAGRLEQFDHSRNPFRVLFFIGQVAWNNLTTRETLFAFYSSYRAGRLEQLDHSRNPFRVLFFIGQVAWNNLTTRETLFAFYSSYRAGRLEQFDHSRNPFRVLFFLSGRSPGTIRPLAKPFLRFILHRAGRLEQLDHSRNPFRFILHRASRLEQLDHSRNSSRSFIIGQVAQIWSISKKKKWVVFQMTCFLISTSPCKSHMSIYCFQNFQDSKKAKVLSVSTFLYKFTTQS